MTKSFIVLLLLTVAVVFLGHETRYLLNGLIYLQGLVTHALEMAFSKGRIGNLIQSVVALLVLPLLSGLVVAGLHRLFKRNAPSHTMAVIWVVWVILIVAVTLKPNVNIHAGTHKPLHLAMNQH